MSYALWADILKMLHMHNFSFPPLQERPLGRRMALGAVAAGALALALPWSARAQAPAQAHLALSTAINRTAGFRALSQRQAKAYAQWFLDVHPARAREVMVVTRQQVQAGFDVLAGATWTPEVTQAITQVQSQSKLLNGFLEQKPTKELVQYASAQADKMLEAANNATQVLEHQAQGSSARLVGLAGRLRWTSQRLAKNYNLLAAGMEAKTLRTQMDADTAEFKNTLAALHKAAVSTPATRTQLDLAQGQWVFFEATVQRQPDARGLEAMATASERMFEVMEQLASAYEVALKDVL